MATALLSPRLFDQRLDKGLDSSRSSGLLSGAVRADEGGRGGAETVMRATVQLSKLALLVH